MQQYFNISTFIVCPLLTKRKPLGLGCRREVNTIYSIYKRLLEERGVNSNQVAKATGINKSTLSRWQKRGTTPRVENLIKIADFLGVSVDVFIEAKRKEMCDEESSSK